MAKYKILENGVENIYEIDKEKADKLINVGVKLSLVKEEKIVEEKIKK